LKIGKEGIDKNIDGETLVEQENSHYPVKKLTTRGYLMLSLLSLLSLLSQMKTAQSINQNLANISYMKIRNKMLMQS